MEQFRIARNLLRSALLTGLFAACNNEQTITPIERDGIILSHQNAKLSPLTRLVKDGNTIIQYVKSGKFFGRISRVDEYGHYVIYSYDDNNFAGNLWITTSLYNTNSNLLGIEHKYLVVNGHCVSSTLKNIVTGDITNFTYSYNAMGQLEEIKLDNGNSYKYSYKYFASTNSYQLHKLSKTYGNIPNGECTFSYTSTPNHYSIGVNYGNVDKYLPIFGRFNDLLVDHVEGFQYGLPNSISWSKYIYTLDSDGLPESITTESHWTDQNGVQHMDPSTKTVKYSSNWQGI